MTILLTILSIAGLIGICWAMAKYNKNDNLFWILLISLFAGMAGGALVNKLSKSSDENTTNFMQMYNPTQVSPADCVDFCTELGDIRADMAKPASKVTEISARDNKVSIAPSKTSGEIRGQPPYFYPLNRGAPGMAPFDTS